MPLQPKHVPSSHVGVSAISAIPYCQFYLRPMANSHLAQRQVVEAFQSNDGFHDFTLATPVRPSGRNQIPTLFPRPSCIRDERMRPEYSLDSLQ